MDDSRFIVAIVVRETETEPPKPPTSPTSSSPRRTRPRHPIRRLWLRPCRRCLSVGNGGRVGARVAGSDDGDESSSDSTRSVMSAASNRLSSINLL
jgi:hypothetical protein